MDYYKEVKCNNCLGLLPEHSEFEERVTCSYCGSVWIALHDDYDYSNEYPSVFPASDDGVDKISGCSGGSGIKRWGASGTSFS